MKRTPPSHSSPGWNHKGRSLKGIRLGLFEPRPMSSPTIAVQGLSARDAVEVLDRKIKRALLAGAEEIRVLFSPEDNKVKKAMVQYLAQSAVVKSFDPDRERDDEILVSLHPMA